MLLLIRRAARLDTSKPMLCCGKIRSKLRPSPKVRQHDALPKGGREDDADRLPYASSSSA